MPTVEEILKRLEREESCSPDSSTQTPLSKKEDAVFKELIQKLGEKRRLSD